MTAIEMKYSLFKEIDSIEDETILNRLAAFLRSLVSQPSKESFTEDEFSEIPEAVRKMSVKTGMTGHEDVKELMHKHLEDKYG